MMTLRALSLSVLLPALLLAGCRRSPDVHTTPEGRLVLGSEQASEIIDRSVSLAGRTLMLEGYSGFVTLTGTDAEVAEIQFEKVVRERDERRAREALAEIRIQESGDAQAYRYLMEARRPEGSDVNIRGRIPRDTPVQIQLGSGDVSIAAVRGRIELEVANGNVLISEAASEVQITVRNGNADVAFSALPERARPSVRTSNGNISIGLAPDLPVRVEAETVAGSIRVQNLTFSNQRLRETVSGATFSGMLASDSARLSARTDNGNILFRATQPQEPAPRTE